MKYSLVRYLAIMPLAVMLLGGACSRSEDEKPEPKPETQAAKTTVTAPAAAAPSDVSENGDSVPEPTSGPLLIYCAQELRTPMNEIVKGIRVSLGLDCRVEYGGAPELLSMR